MKGKREDTKERVPLIEKSHLAYQEFLDDDRVRKTIETMLQNTWTQAVEHCAIVLSQNGDESGARVLRSLKRVPR